MSHMMAVLSTAPDTMKFPSRVQQMSYTSPTCPLKTDENVKPKYKEMTSKDEQLKTEQYWPLSSTNKNV